MYAYIHTHHTHTYIHTHALCTHTYTHTHPLCAYTHTHPLCTHTYIHTYTVHTYIHTRIHCAHTHTHTCRHLSCPLLWVWHRTLSALTTSTSCNRLVSLVPDLTVARTPPVPGAPSHITHPYTSHTILATVYYLSLVHNMTRSRYNAGLEPNEALPYATVATQAPASYSELGLSRFTIHANASLCRGVVARLYAGIDLNPILATVLRPCRVNSCVYCGTRL